MGCLSAIGWLLGEGGTFTLPNAFCGAYVWAHVYNGRAAIGDLFCSNDRYPVRVRTLGRISAPLTSRPTVSVIQRWKRCNAPASASSARTR